MFEALNEATCIHKSALSTKEEAAKLQLLRAGFLSLRLATRAERMQSRLRVALRNCPPQPESENKLRLGGLSAREQSERARKVGRSRPQRKGTRR